MEITVPSGAAVAINPAPFKDAKALKMAIEREIAMSPGFGIPTVLLVDSSPSVDAALWPCLVRCTYADEKITESTFNKAEARADYYAIVKACLEVNLRPLLDGLLSQLTEYGLLSKRAEPKSAQKSPSTMSQDS